MSVELMLMILIGWCVVSVSVVVVLFEVVGLSR